MDNTKIKCCVFCGRKPKMMIRKSSFIKDGFFCVLHCFCGGCNAKMHVHSQNKDKLLAQITVISMWNCRTHDVEYNFKDLIIEDYTLD